MPPAGTPLKRLTRLCATWALLTALTAAPASAQNLVIRFFDVGQGDAALVTSPEGKSALIDGGGYAGWPAYLLDSLGIDTLDLVIASHNHADHIRGLQSAFETTIVRYYMDNGLPANTQVYQSLLDLVEGTNVAYLEATPRTIQLGSAKLRILPSPPGDSSQNNSSVGVLLTYGPFTALFTGDAETEERAFWELNARLPWISVLKVAHHGSSNGTDTPWLRTTKPRVAVISVGVDNGYGHPAASTLRALAAAKAAVYRTDEDGDITVTVTPQGAFTIKTSESLAARTWPSGRVPRH